MALYLSLNMNEEAITEAQLENVCPRRRNNGGRKPTIVANSAHRLKDKRMELWLHGEMPTKSQRRKMLVESLRVALRLVMRNHMYEFDNKIRRQVEGGPIGLELTGTIAQIFMMWYDKELLVRLEENEMAPFMYKRYVDDINAILPKPQCVHGNEGDEDAMLNLQRIGNGIHPSIQLEVDYPTKNEDKKLCILDLKMWVSDDRYMLYKHYMKKVLSRYLVHARSAVAESVKRTVNTQEALRIMLNCSRRLDSRVASGHLQDFVARMQHSGYDVKFRKQVINSAMSAYTKIVKLENDGIRPMYRKRDWKWKERDAEKRKKKKDWYRKGGQQSVLFVPATPDSRLVDIYRREIERSRYKIRLVERKGMSLKGRLQKSNPFGKKSCAREDCLICTSDGRGSCNQNGIVYSIKCECGDQYVGQTARNAYVRGREHLQAYGSKCDSSVMWRHCVDHHGSEERIWKMDVDARYGDDAMKRQIAEAVRIKKVRTKNATMNCKREWRQIEIPRAVIEY